MLCFAGGTNLPHPVMYELPARDHNIIPPTSETDSSVHDSFQKHCARLIARTSLRAALERVIYETPKGTESIWETES